MICKRCHKPMVLASRFVFDHEPTDSQRETDALKRLQQAGIELGARVTLYRCYECDTASADFEYPPKGRSQ